MTGYGRGEAESEGARAVAEIRSVNHRFLDLKLRGSNLGMELEERVRGRVKKSVSRGSVTVTVRVEAAGMGRELSIDAELAARAFKSLRALADSLGVERPIDLSLLCSLPGVVVVVGESEGGESQSQAALDAVDAAIAALLAMRAREGEFLARDLGARLDRLRELAASLEDAAVLAPEAAKNRLSERLERLMAQGTSAGIEIDPARLAQEVAVLADRLDVTEELVRVGAHVEQLTQLMKTNTEPVGRRLDFLVQELGREFNTVASKSQSAQISSDVVEAKGELERIREQVQNIE